jgi:ABC-2 type transport system ATP-binding protein
MEIAIQIEGLTKQFSNHNGPAAIGDVTLDIPAGKLFGLVGPDGAGKTTLLRILSTVLEQTEGRASVSGYDVRHDSGKIRSKIGYMPQNFSLYPDLNVIENLNFFASIHAVSEKRRRERIPEMLAFTRLDAFQNRRSQNLSGGMKKKLALACAMVHEPDVLLLDEPSTGVDPVSRRELWDILSSVVLQGVTVLVTTPYMDEAERCEHVAILHEGKLLTVGTPADLSADLPFEIVEVKAKPRKKMREIAGNEDTVLAWRPVGDRLRLSTKKPDKTLKSLKASFQREDMEIKLLRRARPSMEDVFVHLLSNGWRDA